MPRAARERQMLDAAVSAFGRRGYRATSMDGIAEAAGVSKPLVYLYLHSKEELFTACVRREAEALVSAVREAVTLTDPPEDQLRDGLLAFFTHTAERQDGWAVLHVQARSQGEPFARYVTEMREEIVGFVTQLILTAARTAHDDPSLGTRQVAGLAQALVGAAESLASWANADASVSAREAAGSLMNLAWSGLGGLMAAGRRGPVGDGEPVEAVAVNGHRTAVGSGLPGGGSGSPD
ncbi:TetR/AcrR family transcriptional regulator [Streptomyces tsukubensis]|uniref:TetR/AcrR family transcriptional regulator n=1 Tax=Streptomyces tsukubensis TaxID=83656 RepID=UPI00098F9000|nr:TetR/AcrR family transcriptional regulator [Streptomyces tsukubensis]QFR97928.1 TetR family transcriptional regulator [Streptomyces tsukubensis]